MPRFFFGTARAGATHHISALRRAGVVVAVNLLVLLLLLIPLELIFGGWLGSERDISMLNVKPNTFNIESSPLYPTDVKILYRRDRYGLRGVFGDPRTVDVLVIGGSTTAQRFVDERDTWTAQLQTLLDGHKCRRIIANAGIDGYSTIGHIASFDRWFSRIPGFKPRFVVVYVGVNDTAVSPGKVSDADSQKYSSQWRSFEHYVAGNSAVRKLFVSARGWWQAKQARLPHHEIRIKPDTVWELAVLPATFAADALSKSAAYMDRLKQLNQHIRDFGSQPIYITQHRVDGRLVDGQWQQVVGSNGAKDNAMLDALNRTTLAFCHAMGESCIDLAGQVSFEPGDFYDAVHTTLAGSTRIAAYLADALSPIICDEANW